VTCERSHHGSDGKQLGRATGLEGTDRRHLTEWIKALPPIHSDLRGANLQSLARRLRLIEGPAWVIRNRAARAQMPSSTPPRPLARPAWHPGTRLPLLGLVCSGLDPWLIGRALRAGLLQGPTAPKSIQPKASAASQGTEYEHPTRHISPRRSAEGAAVVGS